MNKSKNFQVINILFNNSNLTKIRQKYDPCYNPHIKNHLTLVYPFYVEDKLLLINHIKKSISKIKPFNIYFSGLRESTKEYYLYLLVSKGKKQVISLYKNLNSGILKNFKNKDMPVYIPHISLGCFKTKASLEESKKQLKKIKINFSQKISSIQLLTIGENNKIIDKKTFKLREKLK